MVLYNLHNDNILKMSYIYSNKNNEIVEIPNLEFCENLIIWGVRDWIQFYAKNNNPYRRLEELYSKYRLEELINPVDEILKISFSYSIPNDIIMPQSCNLLTKGELNLLNAIAYNQNRDDIKSRNSLSQFFPEILVSASLKPINKISEVLSKKYIFLPLRGEYKYYLHESFYKSKYSFH